MSELVQLSKVNVKKESAKGKIKRAVIEGFPEPIRMGLHGGVKKFYRVESGEDLPTTLDYVVAALGSCLTGTLGSALEARSIPIGPEDLSADVEGHIENKSGSSGKETRSYSMTLVTGGLDIKQTNGA